MVKTLGPYTPGIHSLEWKVQTEGSTEVEEASWEVWLWRQPWCWGRHKGTGHFLKTLQRASELPPI